MQYPQDAEMRLVLAVHRPLSFLSMAGYSPWWAESLCRIAFVTSRTATITGRAALKQLSGSHASATDDRKGKNRRRGSATAAWVHAENSILVPVAKGTDDLHLASSTSGVPR